MVKILKSLNSCSSNVLEMSEYILVPRKANNLTKTNKQQFQISSSKKINGFKGYLEKVREKLRHRKLFNLKLDEIMGIIYSFLLFLQ